MKPVKQIIVWGNVYCPDQRKGRTCLMCAKPIELPQDEKSVAMLNRILNPRWLPVVLEHRQ